MTEIRFTWDARKAEANWRKHGIRFEDAAKVFLDPLHLTRQDRIQGGEYRWQTIGRIHGVTLLIVAHTVIEECAPEPVDVIRIISARKANKTERKRHERECN